MVKKKKVAIGANIVSNPFANRTYNKSFTAQRDSANYIKGIANTKKIGGAVSGITTGILGAVTGNPALIKSGIKDTIGAVSSTPLDMSSIQNIYGSSNMENLPRYSGGIDPTVGAGLNSLVDSYQIGMRKGGIIPIDTVSTNQTIRQSIKDPKVYVAMYNKGANNGYVKDDMFGKQIYATGVYNRQTAQDKAVFQSNQDNLKLQRARQVQANPLTRNPNYDLNGFPISNSTALTTPTKFDDGGVFPAMPKYITQPDSITSMLPMREYSNTPTLATRATPYLDALRAEKKPLISGAKDLLGSINPLSIGSKLQNAGMDEYGVIENDAAYIAGSILNPIGAFANWAGNGFNGNTYMKDKRGQKIQNMTAENMSNTIGEKNTMQYGVDYDRLNNYNNKGRVSSMNMAKGGKIPPTGWGNYTVAQNEIQGSNTVPIMVGPEHIYGNLKGSKLRGNIQLGKDVRVQMPRGTKTASKILPGLDLGFDLLNLYQSTDDSQLYDAKEANRLGLFNDKLLFNKIKETKLAKGGIIPLSANAGELVGPTHAQGGIDITPQVEAEGGEVLNKTPQGDTQVFSEQTGFADAVKPLLQQKGIYEQELTNMLPIKKAMLDTFAKETDGLRRASIGRNLEKVNNDIFKYTQIVQQIDTQVQQLFAQQQEQNGNNSAPAGMQQGMAFGGTIEDLNMDELDGNPPIKSNYQQTWDKSVTKYPKNKDYRTWWYKYGPGQNGGVGYQGNEQQAVALFNSRHNNPNFPGGNPYRTPISNKPKYTNIGDREKIGLSRMNSIQVNGLPYQTNPNLITEDRNNYISQLNSLDTPNIKGEMMNMSNYPNKGIKYNNKSTAVDNFQLENYNNIYRNPNNTVTEVNDINPAIIDGMTQLALKNDIQNFNDIKGSLPSSYYQGANHVIPQRGQEYDDIRFHSQKDKLRLNTTPYQNKLTPNELSKYKTNAVYSRGTMVGVPDDSSLHPLVADNIVTPNTPRTRNPIDLSKLKGKFKNIQDVAIPAIELAQQMQIANKMENTKAPQADMLSYNPLDVRYTPDYELNKLQSGINTTVSDLRKNSSNPYYANALRANIMKDNINTTGNIIDKTNKENLNIIAQNNAGFNRVAEANNTLRFNNKQINYEKAIGDLERRSGIIGNTTNRAIEFANNKRQYGLDLKRLSIEGAKYQDSFQNKYTDAAINGTLADLIESNAAKTTASKNSIQSGEESYLQEQNGANQMLLTVNNLIDNGHKISPREHAAMTKQGFKLKNGKYSKS